MPNGEPMPEITILGPGPAYDPVRATFNQWLSEWMRELGMPVVSELSGFRTILGPVFVDATFDMYILGWGLGDPNFPAHFEGFWHSRNDTAVSGNANTPGFNNAQYDALADEFMGTADLERARELAYEMQVMLADQRPYIPLYYTKVIELARDNVVFPFTETLGGLHDSFYLGIQSATQPLIK
jgi:ABC-type transport system substrate-binding protein